MYIQQHIIKSLMMERTCYMYKEEFNIESSYWIQIIGSLEENLSFEAKTQTFLLWRQILQHMYETKVRIFGLWGCTKNTNMKIIQTFYNKDALLVLPPGTYAKKTYTYNLHPRCSNRNVKSKNQKECLQTSAFLPILRG